ncbi:MAG TPA: trypsin-like serine protease [Kofleriaceae bacterium]|nr:trypsin-like serine protease [Kofleriaceae bacterium]
MRWTSSIFLVAMTAAPAAAGPAGTPEQPAPPRPTIVGGTLAQPGDWPDTAGIVFGNEVDCSGVLIAPDLVLTAGHCAGGITAVVLNTTDLSQPVETIPVAQEIEYPRSQQTYDITLLILESPSTVAPRPIATGCIRDTYLIDGAPVEIVGYGAYDAQGTMYDNFLREAETTITDADCSSVDRGCVSGISPGGELGAGGGGIDTCFGDSGGPLYLKTPAGAFVAGLTSRSWDDAVEPCFDGGIYVRPDAVIDWIETTSGETLPPASCNIAPVPTAGMIEAESGGDGSTTVEPNDPDTGDGHSFAIGQAPTSGTAEVDADGVVTYHAPDDFVGDDSLTVVVTDNGDVPKSGTVVIAVTVTESDSGGCGCRAGAEPRSAGGLAVLAFGVLLVLRRRR